MDDTTMLADLQRRLAMLERQHTDQLALMQAAIAVGRTEGQLMALREVLGGLTPDPPAAPGVATDEGAAVSGAAVAPSTSPVAEPG